jgi:tetratricopeptide (TPR) repeat protein
MRSQINDKGAKKDQHSSLRDLTELAEKLEDTGSISEALSAWREALKYYTTPYLLYRFGRLAFELVDWAEVERALLSAIDLAPSFALPYTALGGFYVERGDYELGEAMLTKGLELWRDAGLDVEETAEPYTLLGIAQVYNRTPIAARESFKNAINADPNYEESYYNLAVIEDRPSDAITLFHKAIEIDPEYQAAHRELGRVLKQSQRYREAEYHLRRSLELDDSDGRAYIYLGNLLWTKNELGAAEGAFNRAIEVWPDDSFPHWCLGIFYEYQGRRQEADFFYEKAVQLDPDDPQSQQRFGLFLKKLGENAKAKVHLEQARAALDALDFDPNDELTQSVLSALEELDQTDD